MRTFLSTILFLTCAAACASTSDDAAGEGDGQALSSGDAITLDNWQTHPKIKEVTAMIDKLFTERLRLTPMTKNDRDANGGCLNPSFIEYGQNLLVDQRLLKGNTVRELYLVTGADQATGGKCVAHSPSGATCVTLNDAVAMVHTYDESQHLRLVEKRVYSNITSVLPENANGKDVMTTKVYFDAQGNKIWEVSSVAPYKESSSPGIEDFRATWQLPKAPLAIDPKVKSDPKGVFDSFKGQTHQADKDVCANPKVSCDFDATGHRPAGCMP